MNIPVREKAHIASDWWIKKMTAIFAKKIKHVWTHVVIIHMYRRRTFERIERAIERIKKGHLRCKNVDIWAKWKIFILSGLPVYLWNDAPSVSQDKDCSVQLRVNLCLLPPTHNYAKTMQGFLKHFLRYPKLFTHLYGLCICSSGFLVISTSVHFWYNSQATLLLSFWYWLMLSFSLNGPL